MTNTHSKCRDTQRLPDYLETARCVLKPFETSDLDDLCQLYGDPAVMGIRKIGVQSRVQAAQQLRSILDNWQQLGLGLYAVRDRCTCEFLGECGLRPDSSDPDNGIALSYGLIPTAWRSGIATEISASVLDAWFDNLGLDLVLAFAKAGNPASLRVLDKLGFVRVSPSNGQPEGVVRSELGRAAWSALRRVSE